jgi:hypothetical protein
MGLRLVEGGKGPPKHLNYDTSDVTGIPQTSLFYLRTSSEERLHRHCILGHPELPLFKVQALGQLTPPTSDLLQTHMPTRAHTHSHTEATQDAWSPICSYSEHFLCKKFNHYSNRTEETHLESISILFYCLMETV